MKRRKRNHSPKLRSTPAPVDFHEWKKRFESSLFLGTPASKAFRELVKREARSREESHLPKLPDLRGCVMEGIYKETSSIPRSNDEALKKLTDSLKKLIKQLGVV